MNHTRESGNMFSVSGVRTPSPRRKSGAEDARASTDIVDTAPTQLHRLWRSGCADCDLTRHAQMSAAVLCGPV